MVVSLAAGLGAARLVAGWASAEVLVPVGLGIVAGHGVLTFLRRWSAVVALAVSLAAVVVVATLAVEPSLATRILDADAPRIVYAQLALARRVISSHPTPLPRVAGVVLVIALVSGFLAVATRAIWAAMETAARPMRRPLAALVPSFALLCYSSLFSSGAARLLAASAYVGAAMAFVAIADQAGALPGGTVSSQTWSNGRLQGASPDRGASPGRGVSSSRGMGRLGAAIGAGAVALAVALAASPVFAGVELSAFPAHRSYRPAQISGVKSGVAEVTGLDLIDRLSASKLSASGETMFSAVSPFPTYWQVATLTRFDGTAWTPPAGLAAIEADRMPGTSPGARAPSGERVGRASTRPLLPGPPVLPGPPIGNSFQVEVTTAHLASALLALPPGTLSVRAGGTSRVPGFGFATEPVLGPGSSYSALVGAPQALSRSAALPRSKALAYYLALPRLARVVGSIARRVVAGAATPLAKAEDLVNWFRSGRFRYSLDPPRAAGNPLVSFLTVTRTGYCQQFAGAYAVLAREVGLPSRVAVGFAPGTRTGSGTWLVSGADAHVWPEVYLGPDVGWTPVEPTPGVASTEPVPAGVIVPAGSTTENPGHGCGYGCPGFTTTTVPFTPGTAGTKPGVATPRVHRGGGQGRGGGPGRAPVPVRGGGWLAGLPAWMAALLAIGGLLVAALLVGWVALARRRSSFGSLRLWRSLRGSRSLRRRGARRRPWWGPREEVLASFEEAESILAKQGAGRSQGETPLEHADRVGELGGAGYRALAELATRAGFSADAWEPEEAEHARRLAASVRETLAAR